MFDAPPAQIYSISFIHKLSNNYLIDFYICCVVVCSNSGIYSVAIKCNYKWFRRYFTISDITTAKSPIIGRPAVQALGPRVHLGIWVLRTFDASQTCPGVTRAPPPHHHPPERAVKPRLFLLWLRSLRFVVIIRQVTEGLRFAEPKPSHNQSCAEF